MLQHGITVHQAAGDTDTLIVSVALHAAAFCALRVDYAPMAVVAEDTYSVAFFPFHRWEHVHDIRFVH